MIDRPRAISEAGKNILAREVGEVRQQLVNLRPRGKRIQHIGHPHPGSCYDRPPAANGRVDDDALLAHGNKMRSGSRLVNRPPRACSCQATRNLIRSFGKRRNNAHLD